MSTLASAAPRALACEVAGPADAPMLVALGGISATRHVTAHAGDRRPGWWEGIVGDGCAIDTRSRAVLGVDFLDGGRAPDGRPADIVTTHDQAAALVQQLDRFGVERVDIVGASYGGMVALALAERWPERVRRMVVISAAHRSDPMATALRAVQRRIIELGLGTERELEAMAVARALAMTTYRTRAEFDGRFSLATTGNGAHVEFDVEQYLMRAGARFAERTPPERQLALSLSADLHVVDPRRIRVPATLVAAQGDVLVPGAQMRALASAFGAPATLVQLRSRRGHDAFLTEPVRMTRILRAALAA
ncbi:MAG: homoserine O-succinyltransferase [Gemmatimonadaceae bacterium]|nr:homoserine O-succinyltransferase [Gemmatimonadaceae bacterium]